MSDYNKNFKVKNGLDTPTLSVSGASTFSNTATIAGMSIGLNNGEVSVPGVTVDSDNILVKMNANGGTNGSLIFSGVGTSNTRRAFAIDRNMRLKWFNGATILTALSSTDGSIDFAAGPDGFLNFYTNGSEALIGLSTNSNTIIQAGAEQAISFTQFTDSESAVRDLALLNSSTFTLNVSLNADTISSTSTTNLTLSTNNQQTADTPVLVLKHTGDERFSFEQTSGLGNVKLMTISDGSTTNPNIQCYVPIVPNGITSLGTSGSPWVDSYQTTINLGTQVVMTPQTSDPAVFGSTATGVLVLADGSTWDPANFRNTDYPTYYDGNQWQALGANNSWGSFYQNATITPAAADTAYFLPITQTTANRNMTLGSTGTVTINRAGHYNIDVQIHADNSANAEHTLYVWFKKNGSDIANSGNHLDIYRNSKQNSTHNFLVEAAAGDTFDVMYAVSNTAITMPYTASTSTPFTRPALPSVQLIIEPVGA